MSGRVVEVERRRVFCAIFCSFPSLADCSTLKLSHFEVLLVIQCPKSWKHTAKTLPNGVQLGICGF